MLLIDQIKRVEEKIIVTEAKICADNIFFDKRHQGVPSWVGLEYLAQSAAIWVGIDDERIGRDITLGFLLGSRSYRAEKSVFAENEILTMKVEADFIEASVTVFSGAIINAHGQTLVEGNLTAFRPDDLDRYLAGG